MQKFDQGFHSRGKAVLDVKIRKRGGEWFFAAEKQPPGSFFYLVDLGSRDAGPPHSLGVDGPYTIVVGDLQERRDISPKTGQTGDECEIADRHIVVRSCSAGHHNVVADDDVPGQHHIVGDDAIVADLAIVADVAIDHQQISIAYPCGSFAAGGSDVNGDRLTNDILAADDQPSGFVAEFLILRGRSDHGMGMERVAWTGDRVASEDHMADQPIPPGQLHMGADNAERTDFHIVGELRLRVDQSLGRNLCHDFFYTGSASTSMNLMSASAATLSPTNALQRTWPVRLFTRTVTASSNN